MSENQTNTQQLDPHLLETITKFVESIGDDWNFILPTELKVEMMKNHDYFLLDIRKQEDYAKGHIEGATNIFWLDLMKPENLQKLPRDKRIIIACYVGHTASQVLVMLRLLGFDARILKFGMGKSPVIGVPVAGWENYGFDVVREA
jgi:rhodanese-related sulfurtransferase